MNDRFFIRHFNYLSLFYFVTVKSLDSLGNHLNNLLREAENRIQELSGIEDAPQPFSTRASFSSIIGKSYHLNHLQCFVLQCFQLNLS